MVSLAAGGLVADAGTEKSTSAFVPITPCRLLDTRSAAPVGPRSSPLGQGEIFATPVVGANGNCTIPAQATAVQLGIVAVNGTLPSFLTVFPSDAPLPLASNLNWVANEPPVPNSATATLAADGRLSFFNNSGTVDIAVDIMGYYVPTAGTQGPVGPQGPAGQPGPTGPPGINAVERVIAYGSVLPGSTNGAATATCPAGTTVISGGLGAQHARLRVYGSFPNENGWYGVFALDTTSANPASFFVYAMCATLGR